MAAGQPTKEPAHLAQPDFPDEFQVIHRSRENPGGFLLGARLHLKESPPGLCQRPGLPDRLGISGPLPPDIDIIAKIATAHLFQRGYRPVLHSRVRGFKGLREHGDGGFVPKTPEAANGVNADIDVIITSEPVGQVPHCLCPTDLHPGITGCGPHHRIRVIKPADTDCPGRWVVKSCRQRQHFRTHAGVMLGKHRPGEFIAVASLFLKRLVAGGRGLLPQFPDSLIRRQPVPFALEGDLVGILPRQRPSAPDHHQPKTNHHPRDQGLYGRAETGDDASR